MIKIKDLLTVKEQDVEVVDCGNCPVSIACISHEDVSSFNCCNIAIMHNTVIDCNKHRFNKGHEHDMHCGLCTGMVVDAIVADFRESDTDYVPTVHAKVPFKVRLASLLAKEPLARARFAENQARKRMLKP